MREETKDLLRHTAAFVRNDSHGPVAARRAVDRDRGAPQLVERHADAVRHVFWQAIIGNSDALLMVRVLGWRLLVRGQVEG